MAKTVNGAFDEFRQNYVDLDPDEVALARRSRDNLLENIKEFDNKDDFFDLCQDFDLHFGSFSRKTKCRELNDNYNNVHIYVGNNKAQKECANGDGTLNSTLVLNRFKRELEKLRDYSRSEVKRDHEAINLNLVSRDWAFDIVPCFHTVTESDGRAYYLIPNGNGNWKKTDPTIEQNRVAQLSAKHGGKVRDTIRLVKYWNKWGRMPTMVSYVLETMILDYFARVDKCDNFIDCRFREILKYITENIFNPVYDSKNIEGNINTLTIDQKNALCIRARNDYKKACEAISAEVNEKDQAKSIRIWRSLFGDDFPTFG